MFVLTAHDSDEILRDLINTQRDLFENLGLHFRFVFVRFLAGEFFDFDC